MTLQPSLIPQVRIGDVIRLARDHEKPNTRLALVLEVDQLSSTTLMVSVWWYRTAHNFFRGHRSLGPALGMAGKSGGSLGNILNGRRQEQRGHILQSWRTNPETACFRDRP